MAGYIGNTPENVYNSISSRYMYGLRRTDQGELFVGKLDQASNDGSIELNKPGLPQDNFNNFQEGQDFFEGRNVNHDLVYENLNYEQFRWDDKNIFYYVDAEGVLTARLGQAVTYDDGSSSDGLGS
jgi:hypothetical protein